MRMTVIVWDGKTLAADRESGTTYTKFGAVTKIERAPDGGMFGIAGIASINREIRQWFLDGAAPEDFPPIGRDKDDNSHLLWITHKGEVMLYQRSPHPIRYHNQQYAVGAGAEAAMAVLLLGHDARKAVEIASMVCQGCGNGIDTLTLEETESAAVSAVQP